MKGAIVLCLLMLTPTGATGAVAVTVAHTTTVLEYTSPVPFPDVVVDEGGAWNKSSNKLTFVKEGTYFFHLNAGGAGHKCINMNLEGTVNLADVLRMSTAHTDADTTGRSFITNVKADASVFVSSDAGCALYSDGGRQTSLTAIDLLAHVNGAQGPVVMSVARVQPSSALGAVVFDNELVNLGNGFDFNNTQTMFTAPQAGVYFFVFSAGFVHSAPMRAGVYKFGENGQNTSLAEIWRGHSKHDGPDTASASLLVDLKQGERVFIQLLSGEMYSDGGRQTFFGGFLYSPVLTEIAAWSVYRTSSALAEDPLNFHGSHVNTNNMFDFNQHRVNITISGVYYVTLTVGALADFPVDVFIVRNRFRTELNVYRETGYQTETDSLSQGILLRLSAGNTLRVAVREGSALFSSPRAHTIFSGFLIAP